MRGGVKVLGKATGHMVWISVSFGMVVPVAKGPGYSLNLLIGPSVQVCFLDSVTHRPTLFYHSPFVRPWLNACFSQRIATWTCKSFETAKLIFPVGLPSGSLQSFDAFQSDSVQSCLWIFEAFLVSRTGEAANWRSFIAKSQDGPGPLRWHQYIHICCLKLLLWRKVPTEPQEEGERFTLQDGHLATPRIQDWKSWATAVFTHGDMVHCKS